MHVLSVFRGFEVGEDMTRIPQALYVLSPGAQHPHRETVSHEADGRLIGRCDCGLVKDYTAWRNAYDHKLKAVLITPPKEVTWIADNKRCIR